MENSIEKSYAERFICGIDEVGRGPLAGPVVACAVIMPKEEVSGVNDSKKLSHKKRVLLEEEIKNSALAYGIGLVSEKVIDEINIKKATRLAMKMALEDMIKNYKLEPELILIDAEVIDTSIRQEALIKGDEKSYNIACASILAKEYRDRLMVEYAKTYPHYSFEKNMGYGTKAHREAIKEKGICEIHRLSFLGKILNE